MKNVMIIGAGIGGLTAALELHSHGIQVEVFDSMISMEALGVGINLQPHAMKVLFNLGLLTDLEAASVDPVALSFCSSNGDLVYSEKRGRDAQYNYPQLSIHRGKLQSILYNAFIERIGLEHLYLGHQFTDFHYDHDLVVASFINPDTKQELMNHSGKVLIGADGIGSQVRKCINPNGGDLHFEGMQMWRGTTYMKPPLNGKTILVCGHSKNQLIIYPISKPDQNGHALVNWVVEILDPSAITLHKDLWNNKSTVGAFIVSVTSSTV